MVEREAVGDPPTPVVPDDREAIEAERGHHLHLIAGHSPLGVLEVVEPPGGFEPSR